MTSNLHSPQKDQEEEKHNLLVEVSHKEKQLVLLIHTTGLLNADVQLLYRKVRSNYEQIILNDDEQSELQDIEYCLWKLHYKHIDEFRKRIKKTTTSESKKSGEQLNTNHLEQFKLFLSEAIEFYQNLIVKVRKYYKLPDEPSFSRKAGLSSTFESKKTHICQFLCHRFLVCLGDLARYREQYENPNVQNHSWSMAATHYMEATAIWPNSGNPQNQLAVLATYVGDEFLALYHCIRSLAVKEPFPDAQDNLIVLLERSRSSFSPSHLIETCFDFLKPSQRCSTKTNSKSCDVFSFGNTLTAKIGCSEETDLWSLFIRLISFFFIKSSLDDFSFSFTLIMRELDDLMELDDTKLKASLESYQHMDSIKTGPFRALQVVSIFLYTLQNLISIPKVKDFEDTHGTQLSVLRQLALPATFVFMGRFVDRCLKASALNSCPLLPAVLVFVEWLANGLNEAKKYSVNEKCKIAMSYFFESFSDLLKKFGVEKCKGNSCYTSPLWEDYELRGFTPVACAHELLDFSSHLETTDNFERGTDFRIQRIISAAKSISEQSGGEFFSSYVAQFDQLPGTSDPEKAKPISVDLKTDASDQCLPKNVGESERHIRRENQSADVNSVTTEDEEVILFNPLTRYNSAPACTNLNKPTPSSTSLFIARNQMQGCNPSASPQADISNFRHQKPFKQQELVSGDTMAAAHPFHHNQPISAGPPSLSAWVIAGGNSVIAKEKALSGISKNKKDVSTPIEEVASESLYSLSISGHEESIIDSSSFPTTHHSSSPYAAPAPSAPLLPDDAAWYTGLQPTFRGHKASEGGIISGTEALGNAPSQAACSSTTTSHPNWTAAQAPAGYALSSIPVSMLNHSPRCQMTSSEWLRHYLQTHHNLIDHSYNNQAWPWPWPSYHHASTGTLGNSNPMASNTMMQAEAPPFYMALPQDYSSGMDVQQREKLLYGYQRPSPYVCGTVTDVMISEPQPLLQYLKERERQLQAHDPRATLTRGPAYMGN